MLGKSLEVIMSYYIQIEAWDSNKSNGLFIDLYTKALQNWKISVKSLTK